MDSIELKVINPYCCDVKFLKDEKVKRTLYSIPKESAIRIITSERINKKFSEVTLEEFLNTWKTEFEIIKQEINTIFYENGIKVFNL